MTKTVCKGLSNEARAMVAGDNKTVGQQVTVMVYHDGRLPVLVQSVEITEPTAKRIKYADYLTTGGNAIYLQQYAIEGKVYDEFVQKTVQREDIEFVFLALVAGGNPILESYWTDKAIEEAMMNEEQGEMGKWSPS